MGPPTIKVYRSVKNVNKANSQDWDSGTTLTPTEIQGGWWTVSIAFSATVFPEYTYYWRLYSWQSWRGLFINIDTENFWSYEFDANGNQKLTFGFWRASARFNTSYPINVPGYADETWEWRFDIVDRVGKSYYISFDIDGGSGTTPTYLTSSYYNIIYFPNSNAFSRTGYTFNGWKLYGGNNYIATYNAGDEYTWKEPYALTNHVAYAIWSGNTYKIYYNPNGGTGTAPAITNATYGSNVTLTTNLFTKTGYTFSGWGTSATSTSSSYTDGKTFSYNIADSITLYAIWLGNPYNITYNANGGTGTMSQTEATYGSDVTLRANIFERTGYNFSGWGTSPTSTSSSYANSQTFSYNIANTIILYARWIIITKTVTFNNNQIGTISRNVTQNYGTNVNFPTFKAVGYTFVRWVDVNNLPYTFINPLTDDKILFAVWEKKNNINFSELSRVYNGTRSTESKGSKSISIGNFRPESGRGPNETIKLIENFKTKG
jgi:uncharacterized repeat protein (TIGR02543 family)